MFGLFGDSAPEWLRAELFGAVAAFFGGAFSLFFRPVRQFFAGIGSRLTSFLQANARLSRVNASVADGSVWMTSPVVRPKGYDAAFMTSVPILAVANLKGGVGKTTVAANLGGYFAVERQERVLLIDLDFQGSLSSMLLTNQFRLPNGASKSMASLVLDGDVKSEHLAAMARPVRHTAMGAAYAIPAYYDLAETETKTMVHWLSKKSSGDCRYSLAELLHHPSIADQFDRIILDAPPRFGAATIQALCAATHVLAPTILDRLSGEAVGAFLDQLERHRATLWPYLKIIGVSPQLVSANMAAVKERDPDLGPEEMANSLLVPERSGLAEIRKAIERVQLKHGLERPPASILPFETFIAKRAPIASSAGQSVAFLDISSDLKAMFRNLGEDVANRMDRNAGF